MTNAANEGAAPSPDRMSPPDAGWREEYAYSIALQAYIFGFPYIYLPSLRWSWVAQPKPPGATTPYAPLNHFNHVRHLTDADYRDGGSPNNDTLYSTAWVDVAAEPVILAHPEMGDRYFTFEMGSLDSDNFAYVGARTTGSRAGAFAITGPGWNGALPDGITALPPSRTNSLLILGRTLVNGPDDVAAVNALQDQYRLVPLSHWGKDGPLPARQDIWRPFDSKADPLADWKTMNRAMSEDPPEARLASLLSLFAEVGVGPGLDVEAVEDAYKAGLVRAAIQGRALLHEAVAAGYASSRINNWNVPPRSMGRAGQSNQFLLRAAIQCLGGIISNDPEEAVYFNTRFDAEGNLLQGGRAYLLRFEPGQLPPVGAFWSLTLYDETFNLVANALNRYSIGNRTEGLERDPDGELSIAVQSERPGGPLAANWLPSPPAGGFQLILRAYLPQEPIINQQWKPPAVASVS